MDPILVLSNADQIIQLRSGRLAGEPGTENPPDRSVHIICDDASILLSVAHNGPLGGPLSEWLSTNLPTAAQEGRTYREVFQALAVQAGALIRSAPALEEGSITDLRFTLMGSGYTADGFVINAFVSNFHDFEKSRESKTSRDKFTVHVERSIPRIAERPSVIRTIGQLTPLSSEDEQTLRQLLLSQAPVESILEIGLGTFQRLSALSGQADSTDVIQLSYAERHHEGSVKVIRGQQKNLARTDLRGIAAPIPASATPARSFFALTGVSVHRNAPCPCGSGQKYRDCHRIVS